jgi:ribosomal protein S18 acetylase RimI-like enzyme
VKLSAATDRDLCFGMVEDHEYKDLVPIAQEAFGFLHPENSVSGSPYRRALAQVVNNWTPKEMADYLHRRSRKRLFLPHVLRVEKRVVGYALHRRNSDNETIISQLAVAADCRGQGYGKYMISQLVKVAMRGRKLLGFPLLGMKVPDRDLQTQLFLKNCGFQWTRTVKFHSEDCYWMFRHQTRKR